MTCLIACMLTAGLIDAVSGQDRPSTEPQDVRTIPLSEHVSAQRARPDRAAIEKSIIDRTNHFRRQHGLETVDAGTKLNRTAQQFADYMARNLKYGHRADGRTPAERVSAQDYDYCLVTENIAYAYHSDGFTSAALTDKFFVGWQESPEHRENMLDKHATETGVAIAQHADHPTYFAVQLFARPRSAAIEFTLANRTQQTFRYTLSVPDSRSEQPDQELELPPGLIRRHRQCLPSTLSIAGGNRTLVPHDGAYYEFSSAGEGRFRVRRVDAQ